MIFQYLLLMNLVNPFLFFSHPSDNRSARESMCCFCPFTASVNVDCPGQTTKLSGHPPAILAETDFHCHETGKPNKTSLMDLPLGNIILSSVIYDNQGPFVLLLQPTPSMYHPSSLILLNPAIFEQRYYDTELSILNVSTWTSRTG